MTPVSYAPIRAELIAREALRRGPLTRARKGHWRFGRRSFNEVTISALIAAGDAVRVGDTIIAASAGERSNGDQQR